MLNIVSVISRIAAITVCHNRIVGLKKATSERRIKIKGATNL